MPDRAAYKRAPAPLWGPGAAALQSVEVGAVAVVRLPIMPPVRCGGLSLEWENLRGKEFRATDQDRCRFWWRNAPLAPGDRLWVPETWGLWGLERSPWHMPREEADLFARVEGVGVEPWCAECVGEGVHYVRDWAVMDPFAFVDDGLCRSCHGTPPPAWCIELRREGADA